MAHYHFGYMFNPTDPEPAPTKDAKDAKETKDKKDTKKKEE